MFVSIRRFRSALSRSLVAIAMAASLAPVATRAASDPQVVALATLQEASAVPLRLDVHGGVARSARFDVAVSGADGVARARDFLSRYGDLFLRDDAPGDFGVPDLLPAVQLPVRRVAAIPGGEVVQLFQTFDGIPVFGAGLAIGIADASPKAPARAVFATGNLLPAVQRDLDLVPAISADAAALAAASSLGRDVRDVAGAPRLLVYAEAVAREKGAGARLVWAVGVAGVGEPFEVLVDAHTGEEAFRHRLTTDDATFDSYWLDLEDAHFGTMQITNCFNPTTLDEWIGDETGIVSDYLGDAHAVDAWFHVRNTYAYWHDHLGRHSWDDDGDLITTYVHAGTMNANYRHGCGIQFGDLHLSLDIAAHEFTHGVVAHTSALVYYAQPGAINESFADIFGVLVDGDDWKIGEDSGVGTMRDVQDPDDGICANGDCGDPDRWPEFVVTTADEGGVHTNSGIGNKVAYLMIEGGNFNGVDVGAGLGRTKFEKLAYLVLQILPMTASYADLTAAYGVVADMWAANGINGFDAADACVVRNALGAVELREADEDCDGLGDATDDSDGDGVFQSSDNCPDVINPSQEDNDFDGAGDACDDDVDSDGCPNALDLCPNYDDGACWGWPVDTDGDGLGQACDTDDDNDGVWDSLDNCPLDANADQRDGDGNGEGDACDPDSDGDGVFTADNCPFVANPGQEDADGDGVGDACDNCPDAANPAIGYTSVCDEMTGHCWNEPLQGDVDGDGWGNTCDGTLHGIEIAVDAIPLEPEVLRADGTWHAIDLGGDAGDFAIPLPICSGDDADAPRPGERIELAVMGLDERLPLVLWIADELERPVARLSGAIDGELRGLHFTPDCRHGYALHGQLADATRASFSVRFAETSDVSGNPWQTSTDLPLEGPPRPADRDGDGSFDHADNCPAVANANQRDRDGDGVGDACDRGAPACGLGTEMALLLPLWWRLRRRARR